MIDYNNLKQQLIKALYKGFSSSLMDMIKINTEPHGKYGKLTQVKHHVNPNKDQPVNHSKSGLDTPINGYSLLSNLITYGKSEVSQQDKTNYQLLEQLHEEKLKHIVQLLKSPAYNNYTKYYDAADAWRDLGGNEDFGEDTEYNHWERNLTDFEYQSIVAYCGSKWTYPLNNWLRGITNPNAEKHEYTEHELNIMTTITQHLDQVIKSYNIKKPMVLHRQVRIDVLEKFMNAPNGIYRDNGFISTTPIQGSFDLGNVEKLDMIIKVPSGKGIGAWIAPISGCWDENEFLLARGTGFKTTSVDVKKKNNKPVSALLEVTAFPAKQVKLSGPTEEIDYDIFFKETDDDQDK